MLLHCIVLYCMALHCIVLMVIVSFNYTPNKYPNKPENRSENTPKQPWKTIPKPLKSRSESLTLRLGGCLGHDFYSNPAPEPMGLISVAPFFAF